MTENYATIRDRIKELNLEYPTKKGAWTLGSKVRSEFVRVTGESPLKKLGEKTSGRGSHCFAFYPESFWSRMDEIIKSILNSPQGLLPFR